MAMPSIAQNHSLSFIILLNSILLVIFNIIFFIHKFHITWIRHLVMMQRNTFFMMTIYAFVALIFQITSYV